MEEVYRNIVGITEGIQLQASSLVELARENLRLVTYSITLLTSLLRKKNSRLASCPLSLKAHYQGEKMYLENHIEEVHYIHREVTRIINPNLLQQGWRNRERSIYFQIQTKPGRTS